MSTAYSSAKQKYIGNGVTTEWGFDFPIQKHSELKVYLKRSGMPQVLLEEGVDYSFVTENTIAFPIKTGEAKLQAADVLAMQRESVFESEYNFSNQQRLEPEEVMHADDNLERQIQELKRDSESSIKVLPTSSVDPTTLVEHVERVYGSVDNIDTVANDKANVDKVAGSITNVNTVAGDIESVKTVANNIEPVVVDATNISDIKTVAGSISNVNKTAGSIDNVNVVAPSISSVNTVSANISSVNTAASNIAAIQYAPTAANNAAQSAANAANSATISANSAIWAEGTDAQVQALGGVHSSKVWAEQSTNANIALTNSPYTTNRILEIPQDIKPELNNGALTLKAGSKVYVPNGVGVFDEIVFESDLSTTGLSYSKPCFVMYDHVNKTISVRDILQCQSGTSTPTSEISGVGVYYNTSENKVYLYANNTWVARAIALPLCIVNMQNSSPYIASINQVFNGFGYIGSTVFALPGVKVQIPNGRNDDGTNKSILVTTTAVSTNQYNSSVNIMHWFINSLGHVGYYGDNSVIYNENTNFYEERSSGNKYFCVVFAESSYSTGKVSDYKSTTVDSVVNSNEFYQLKDKAVTTDTAQTISGEKTFYAGTLHAASPLLLKQNNVDEGGQIDFERSGNSVLKNDPYIDLFANSIRFVGTSSNNALNITLQVDLENNQVIVPSPAENANDNQAATTGWVNAKKETIVGWGMPNYSAGVNMGAGTTHTATRKGWVMFKTSSTPGTGVIQINGIEFSKSSSGAYGTAYDTVQEFIPVDVGDTFFITNNATAVCIFYPCKGV